MSAFVEATRGLLLPPKGASYNDIRPHHVVVFIGLYKLMKSSSLYRRFTDSILTLLGRTSEAFLPLVYCGVVPDFVIRFGIRLQLKSHLVQLKSSSCEDELSNKMKIVEELSNMPIAIETDLANEQHYEVPPQFYDLCLGPAKKYSSGLWANSKTTFEESETAMLDLYCERAELQDGMKIVDLGCGWGSLTLHLMKKYPNAKVTSISNSHSQREYILKTAQQRGYNVSNLQVITCNVADDKGALDVVKNNDRVMTIEM
jgi:cyclopropane-fatty-acyl-phospholipid synthase